MLGLALRLGGRNEKVGEWFGEVKKRRGTSKGLYIGRSVEFARGSE